jgi:hypothetical protein
MIEVRTFCVEYDNFPERSRGNEWIKSVNCCGIWMSEYAACFQAV